MKGKNDTELWASMTFAFLHIYVTKKCIFFTAYMQILQKSAVRIEKKHFILEINVSGIKVISHNIQLSIVFYNKSALIITASKWNCCRNDLPYGANLLKLSGKYVNFHWWSSVRGKFFTFTPKNKRTLSATHMTLHSSPFPTFRRR